MYKYMVVLNDDLDKLIKIVNEMIEDGWRPQGGVEVAYSNKNYFFQAMVRD
jgi:pentatricopeptide repeat protein